MGPERLAAAKEPRVQNDAIFSDLTADLLLMTQQTTWHAWCKAEGTTSITMKHLLSALPLLLAAAVIAVIATAFAFDLRIFNPNTLALGAGIFTCAGLCTMSGADARTNRCG